MVHYLNISIHKRYGVSLTPALYQRAKEMHRLVYLCIPMCQVVLLNKMNIRKFYCFLLLLLHIRHTDHTALTQARPNMQNSTENIFIPLISYLELI